MLYRDRPHLVVRDTPRTPRPHPAWNLAERCLIGLAIGVGAGKLFHTELLGATLLGLGLSLLMRPLFEEPED